MTEDRRLGLLALALTVFCFGTLWTAGKFAIDHVPPLWFTAGRFAIGSAFIAALLALQGRLALPARADIPIILSVGGLMFGVYSSVFQFALQYVHAGRATILGYTTAIFVTPAAALFLGERLTSLRLSGLLAAVAGFLVLFNPLELDWSDGDALTGNAMIVFCVIMWSGVILHIRVHRHVSDALQLVPCFLLVACAVATASALVFEGLPDFEMTGTVWWLYLYSGAIASGLGNWGVTTAIRNLPSAVSTVGLLGVPVFALVISVLLLGEALTWSLAAGIVLIVVGIAVVTLSRDEGGLRGAD